MTSWKEKIFDRGNFLLGIATILPLTLAFFPSMGKIVAIAMAVIILFLFDRDEFYMIFPILLFFYSQLVLPGGMALYRFFNYVFLVKILFDYHKISISYFMLAPVVVLTIYCLSAMMPMNWVLGLSTLADVLLSVLMTSIIVKNTEMFHKVFRVFVFVALISGFYGILGGHAFRYVADFRTGVWATYVTRYLGSFVDPNYAGFFFNLALFSVLSLNLFKNWKIKYLIAAMLLFFLIATGSMSAMLCFFGTLLVFILLKYPKRLIPAVAVLIVVSGGFYALAKTVPAVGNIQVIADFITRVDTQLGFAKEGETAKLTSGRTLTWQKYLGFYNDQTVTKKMIGGNVLCTSYASEEFSTGVEGFPHQAYIGILINIGFLGLVVLLICFFIKMLHYALEYFRRKEDKFLYLTIAAFIWFSYGMGIDYFLDWKFFFFYFL